MRKTIAIAVFLAAAAWQGAFGQGSFSQKPPGGLDAAQIPMFICLGFDDNARVEGIQWFTNFVKNRKNPAGTGAASTFDGTPIRATWYLTANYITNEGFVEQGPSGVPELINAWKTLYQDGHEIANHTWDHPHGSGLDVAGWKDQINRANDLLSSTIGVPKNQIVGFRTPFLEYTTATLQALKDLGFRYDCSIEFGFTGWVPTGDDTGYWNGMTDPNTHKKLWWPWTLDAGSPPGNASKGNPMVAGLWEMPVFSYIKAEGGEVTGFDFNLWKVNSKAQFVATLKQNFDLRRAGNRNPLTINLHSDYYTQYNVDANTEFTQASWQERQQAMEEFLTYVLTFPETRIVPYKDVLNWMEKPVTLGGAAGTIKSPKVLKQAARSLKLSGRGMVEIELPSPGHYDFTLATASGKSVLKKSGRFAAGTARIHAGADLRPGVYFLKISDGLHTEVRQAVLSK